MAGEEKLSTLLLRYSVDKNSINQAISSSKSIRSEMAQVALSAKSVDLATLRTGDSIRKSFGSSGSASIKAIIGPAESATKQMNALRDSVTGVQSEIKTLRSLKTTDILDLEPELASFGGKNGKRSVSETLKFIGREGRALPSQQIPGLGVGTDAISKIVGLFGQLSPTALKTGVAIAGVSVALAFLADNARKAAEAARADLDARRRALELLSTASREEVQARIKALQDQKAANLAAVNDANTTLAKLRSDIFNTAGTFGLAISDFNSTIGTGAGELTGAKGNLDAANTAFAQTNVELTLLEAGLVNVSDAAGKAAFDLARATNAIALDTARINAQVEAANLAANGTEKQVQDRIDSLSREKAVLLANLPIMQANLNSAVAGGEAQKAFQTQIDSTRSRLAELDTTMTTLAGDTLAVVKANDAAIAAEQKRAELIKIVEASEADRLRITESGQKKEIELSTKFSDKLIEIAAKTADDAAKLLENLEQKLASLSTDVGRDLAKDGRKAEFEAAQARVDFQRSEVAATQKHYQDLDRIRRQAQQEEFSLGLDRNFSGLAESRRNTANQIAEATIQANQDRQARLDSFTAEQADNQAQFIFSRQERILQFEQDIADARAHYTRERLQLTDAKTKQLAAAKSGYDKELALSHSAQRASLAALDASTRAELNIKSAGQTARLQLETVYYQQAISILRNAVNSIGGSAAAGASLSSGLTGGIGGGTASGGVGGTGGLGGIFGFSGASKTTATNRNTVNLTMPISITTGASQSQVRAILPELERVVDRALTVYTRQIFGAA